MIGGQRKGERGDGVDDGDLAEVCSDGLAFGEANIDDIPDWPEFSDLIRVWADARSGHQLPAWQNFAQDDLIPWIGRCAISRHDELSGIRFILFGSEFSQIFGHQMNGTLSIGNLRQRQKRLSSLHFERLLSGRFIGRCDGALATAHRGRRKFALVSLPMSEIGDHVSHLLHAVAGRSETEEKN